MSGSISIVGVGSGGTAGNTVSIAAGTTVTVTNAQGVVVSTTTAAATSTMKARTKSAGLVDLSA
ncbi:MAG: hypothetical protein P4M00_24990 [Azospirillaceae bacterium]|nr:hypothetical protein [Azospirillaceae bacterium]